MANSLSQDIIAEGFTAELAVSGKTVWAGAPAWESATGIFEEITELDPDFPLGKDIREAARLHIQDPPAASFRPGVAVHVGDSPLQPESRWSILPGSRKDNPISGIITFIVQKTV